MRDKYSTRPERARTMKARLNPPKVKPTLPNTTPQTLVTEHYRQKRFADCCYHCDQYLKKYQKNRAFFIAHRLLAQISLAHQTSNLSCLPQSITEFQALSQKEQSSWKGDLFLALQERVISFIQQEQYQVVGEICKLFQTLLQESRVPLQLYQKIANCFQNGFQNLQNCFSEAHELNKQLADEDESLSIEITPWLYKQYLFALSRFERIEDGLLIHDFLYQPADTEADSTDMLKLCLIFHLHMAQLQKQTGDLLSWEKSLGEAVKTQCTLKSKLAQTDTFWKNFQELLQTLPSSTGRGQSRKRAKPESLVISQKQTKQSKYQLEGLFKNPPHINSTESTNLHDESVLVSHQTSLVILNPSKQNCNYRKLCKLFNLDDERKQYKKIYTALGGYKEQLEHNHECCTAVIQDIDLYIEQLEPHDYDPILINLSRELAAINLPENWDKVTALIRRCDYLAQKVHTESNPGKIMYVIIRQKITTLANSFQTYQLSKQQVLSSQNSLRRAIGRCGEMLTFLGLIDHYSHLLSLKEKTTILLEACRTGRSAKATIQNKAGEKLIKLKWIDAASNSAQQPSYDIIVKQKEQRIYYEVKSTATASLSQTQTSLTSSEALFFSEHKAHYHICHATAVDPLQRFTEMQARVEVFQPSPPTFQP